MNTCTSDHPAVRLLTDHPDRFARQGAVVASWRTSRGRRLGPYCRLAWRDGRRQRSIYLGRLGPVVRQVRILLHQAHAPRRLKRQARLRNARFRQEVIRPLNQYIQQMFALFKRPLPKAGQASNPTFTNMRAPSAQVQYKDAKMIEFIRCKRRFHPRRGVPVPLLLLPTRLNGCLSSGYGYPATEKRRRYSSCTSHPTRIPDEPKFLPEPQPIGYHTGDAQASALDYRGRTGRGGFAQELKDLQRTLSGSC